MFDINSRFNRLFHNITYKHAFIGILCLGFSIRLLGLSKGIWLDEYYLLKVISAENFFQILPLQNKPPLFYLFHKLWSQISINEPFLRLLSVIFGMGTIIIMMNWIKRYSRLASLLSGLVCATLPIMLRYSQEIRGYSVLIFATICSFYFASNLTTTSKKSRDYIGLACSLTGAIATQLIGIMLIPSILIFIVILLQADYRKIELRKITLAVIIPCIFSLYLYLFFFHQLPSKHDWWMPPLSAQLILFTFKQVLGVSFLTGQAHVLQNYIPGLAILYKYFIIFLVIGISISVLFLGNWRRGGPLFLAAVFYWLQLCLCSLLVMPSFWDRTVLPGLVPFIGFVGIQIATIPIKKIQRASIVGIGIVMILFVVGWSGYKAWVPYEQWKQLSKALEFSWKSNDLVIFYPSEAEGPVRYYFSDLPSKATIAVKKGANIGELEWEAWRETDALARRETSYRIFLVTRFSLAVQKDVETYNMLLEHLEYRAGQPLSLQKFGILSLSTYEARETINE